MQRPSGLEVVDALLGAVRMESCQTRPRHSCRTTAQLTVLEDIGGPVMEIAISMCRRFANCIELGRDLTLKAIIYVIVEFHVFFVSSKAH